MDLEKTKLSEISQKKKQTLCDLIYKWNLKKPNSEKQRVKQQLPGAGE